MLKRFFKLGKPTQQELQADILRAVANAIKEGKTVTVVPREMVDALMDLPVGKYQISAKDWEKFVDFFIDPRKDLIASAVEQVLMERKQGGDDKK